METIQIDKMCQLCNKAFIAKRTNTQYCSGKCSSRAYKLRKRNSKTANLAKRTKPTLDVSKVESIKHKEILNISETALYIGVSRPTIYTYLKNRELKSMRLGNRTFIKKSDIDALFDYKYQPITIIPSAKEPEEITEFYTIAEIKEKFNVKESWIFKIIRENNIPKMSKRRKSYVSKKHIDRYFKKKTEAVDDSIKEWYSIEEISQIYSMTKTAIYSYVYENNIPKKRDGRKTLYSQTHFDEARGNIDVIEQNYYTTSKAMEKFNLTQDSLYSLVSYHKLPKMKEGQNLKILKSALDTLLKNKI